MGSSDIPSEDEISRKYKISKIEAAKVVGSFVVLGCAAATVDHSVGILWSSAICSVVVSIFSIAVIPCLVIPFIWSQKGLSSPLLRTILGISAILWVIAFPYMFKGASHSRLDVLKSDDSDSSTGPYPSSTNTNTEDDVKEAISRIPGTESDPECDAVAPSFRSSCGSTSSNRGHLPFRGIKPRSRFSSSDALDTMGKFGEKMNISWVAAFFGALNFIFCLGQGFFCLINGNATPAKVMDKMNEVDDPQHPMSEHAGLMPGDGLTSHTQPREQQ